MVDAVEKVQEMAGRARAQKQEAWCQFTEHSPDIAQQMRDIAQRFGIPSNVRLMLDGEVVYGPERTQAVDSDWSSPVLRSRYIGRD